MFGSWFFLIILLLLRSVWTQKWGTTFGARLKTNIVDISSCTYNRERYCCEITDPKRGFYPNKQLSLSEHQIADDVGVSRQQSSKNPTRHIAPRALHSHKCNFTRGYMPSPYELLHMEYGMRISNASESERYQLMKQIMWDDAEHVPKLIDATHRMVRHKQAQWRDAAEGVGLNESDPSLLFYLSRINFRVHCLGNVRHEWSEWIEPLTVYGRHPMYILSAKPTKFGVAPNKLVWEGQTKSLPGFRPTREICDTDYLLGSGIDDAQQRVWFRALGSRRTDDVTLGSNNTGFRRQHAAGPHPRAYFFDMGTSTFISSLTYFTCMYAQQGIAFDHIYGWEYTLLEPTNFWSKVPPPMKPHYSFFNIPVSGDASDVDKSFVQFLADTVSAHDFVAIKLDIDTPDIENKIAMDLFADQQLANLVDELYFELHFRCPIMMPAGWDDVMPHELFGLRLDTGHVLEFFAGLRRRGIRAHMWV